MKINNFLLFIINTIFLKIKQILAANGIILENEFDRTFNKLSKFENFSNLYFKVVNASQSLENLKYIKENISLMSYQVNNIA